MSQERADILNHKGLVFLIQPIVMISLGVLICSLCFYPGTLSLDSQWQLEQAYKNAYVDLHPPIMSYIWHWLNVALPSTQGNANMFLFIVSIYTFAIVLIGFAEQQSTASRWAFFFITLLFPPALLILGSIVKDTLMAVILLLAYAMMIHAEQKRSQTWLYLALLPLFVGFASRHNSIFAVFPFCIWFAPIFSSIWNRNVTWLALKYVIYATIPLLLISTLTVTNHWFVSQVIKAEDSHASQYLVTYDLVGVSVRAKTNCLPAFYDRPSKPITGELLNKIYRPYTNYYVFWRINPQDPTLDCIWSKQEEKELISAWIDAAISHPKAMLLHKIEIFLSMIGILNKHYQLKANQLNSPLGIAWAEIVSDRIMDGWIYLLLFPIFIFARKTLTNPQKVLMWSGYLYGLSWIISTPNSEQRYLSWVIICFTVLATSVAVKKTTELLTTLRLAKKVHL